MNLAMWLMRTAQTHAARGALFDGSLERADYRGFAAQAACFGASLTETGVTQGDRVALFMTNSPEYLVALFGIWAAGGVVVPINAKLHPKEVADLLEDCEARLVLASSDLIAGLEAATDVPLLDAQSEDFAAMCSGPTRGVAQRAPNDVAWLFYTSGTTGRSKGVIITHGMLIEMSLTYLADVDQIGPDDTAIYAGPMSHGAGLYAALNVLRGLRHVFPRSGRFEPEEILDLSDRFGSVSMFMAPTMVRRFLDHSKATGHHGDGIRTIVYAGGPMYSADIIEAVDWFGAKFVQIYGQGECPMSITALSRGDIADRSHPRWRERLGSVGTAQSVVEIAIGDDAGRRLGRGETGEVMVRGRTVMPGYWRAPKATAAALVDGWLMTGDVGRIDEDGYLTLTDRNVDLIISGGANVYPREVEEVLLNHPNVHEVAVVGQKDAEWGEIVVAFVVARTNGFDAGALDAHCKDNIARFKRPKAYRQVDELPKNNYGKVLKTALRAELERDLVEDVEAT